MCVERGVGQIACSPVKNASGHHVVAVAYTNGALAVLAVNDGSSASASTPLRVESADSAAGPSDSVIPRPLFTQSSRS